jgi:mannose-1-phosphate guanylyltransferase
MMTFECDSPESCGVVETDTKGVVIAFHEKILNLPSSLANGAVYLLEPEVLEWLESKPSITDFSTEVLPHYVGRIATWHNSGIHRDIGTLSRLRAAQTDQIPPHLVLGKDEWQQDFESSPIFNELMRYIEPQELLNDR